jgi:hypothetical protein
VDGFQNSSGFLGNLRLGRQITLWRECGAADVVPGEDAMAKEIEDALRSNAQGPAEVSGDSGSMKQHSLRDQIEADRYLNSKAASRRRNRGLNIAKMSPPGAA